MRILHLLLHLHPRAWRNRYEEEMLTVLEEHTITLATFLDLFLGLIDAWLDPYYRSEKGLFSPQNSSLTAMTFVTLLAMSTATLFIWQFLSMPDLLWHSIPQSGNILLLGDESGIIGYNFAMYAVYAEFFLLLLANLSFSIRALRLAPPTQKKRAFFLALACWLLPLLALQRASFIGVPLAPVSNLNLMLFYFMALEIGGCALFLGLMKAKQIANARQKGLLILIVAVVLLPALSLFMSEFFGGVYVPGWLVPPASAFNRVQAFVDDFGCALLLFVGFGGLLLAVGTNELQKPLLRRALSYAFMFTATIAVPLIIMVVWNLVIWIRFSGAHYASPLLFNWTPLGHLLGEYKLQLFFSLALFTLILVASIGITLIRGYRSLSSSTSPVQSGEQSTSEMMQMQQPSR